MHLVVQFTSTQSIFVMTAGPVDLNVNFLSPVEVHTLLFAHKRDSFHAIFSPQISSGSPSPCHIWHYPRCLMMARRIQSVCTLT